MVENSAAADDRGSCGAAAVPVMDERIGIAVIGAGPAGIAMAVSLLEAGITDFTVFEKADALGGTWRDNRYPGVACDVPAHYYSYSFAPNASARTTFASGAELFDYFSEVATQRGVLPHIRYRSEIASADWDGQAWELRTGTGEVLHADVVVTAVGRLHRPRFPDIEGLDDFAGLLRHSSQWDPDTDLAGRRLAIIGTGSSATQMVAGASPVVEHLDLFQRTPQWVMPMPNEVIPDDLRARLQASPAAAKERYDAVEQQITELAETVLSSEGDAKAKRDAAIKGALARVADPELRAKLTPDYEIGCKRLIVSGTFYDAVQRDNVEVVTDKIARVEPDGVRTVDGVLHPADVLILATGFRADSFLRPMTVTGEGGHDLDDIWASAYVNYKSVAIPHLPNLFTINGPFSPGGSISILTVIENHVRYITTLVQKIRTEHVSIAPEPDRTGELFEQVRDRAKHTVWFTGGCSSWYLDADGVPIVSPQSLTELREDLQEPHLEDYTITPLPEAAR